MSDPPRRRFMRPWKVIERGDSYGLNRCLHNPWERPFIPAEQQLSIKLRSSVEKLW